MKRKFKLLGVHIVAILAYVALVLPFVTICIAFILFGALIQLYLHTFKIFNLHVFKVDKPRKSCYNVIESDEK